MPAVGRHREEESARGKQDRLQAQYLHWVQSEHPGTGDVLHHPHHPQSRPVGVLDVVDLLGSFDFLLFSSAVV